MIARQLHRGFKTKLKVVAAIFGALLLVITAGLGYRQILHQEAFSERETLQSQRRILLPGPRGNILDREGRILVDNRPRFAAVIHLSDANLRRQFRQEYLTRFREAREAGERISPRQLEIAARAAVVQQHLDTINALLQADLAIDPAALDRHFRIQPLLPFNLINDLNPEAFARLLENLPVDSPVQITSSHARNYPHGPAAAHSLGYVVSSLDLPLEDLPGGALTTFATQGSFGRSGLERGFDDILRGTTGLEIWVVDPAGFNVERIEYRPPVQGQNLATTLDLDLQLAGEAAFADRRGGLAAIDITNGEVLAIVSKPAYDLNELSPSISRETFTRIEEEGAWLNRVTQGLYPPGSTYKLITAIAALRAGLLDPEIKINCPGYHQVAGRRFPCHNRRGHGDLDLAEAIRVSCNVYFYKVGLETGVARIAEESRRFGLHEPTGIEIPFEARGMIIPDDAWKRQRVGMPWFPGDTANLSIGQGYLRTTPLHMALFTAGLARDQTGLNPTIIRRSPSRIEPAAATPIGLSPLQRESLLAGMEEAVQQGTARFTRLPGIRVGAKTGTAQVRTPEGTLELAWTIAIAPMDQPRIAVAVVVEGEDPDVSNAGGMVAAPVVRQVLQAWFQKHPWTSPEVAAAPPR